MIIPIKYGNGFYFNLIKMAVFNNKIINIKVIKMIGINLYS